MFPTLAHDSTLSPASRVWVYTAQRRLTEAEVQVAQQALDTFARQWTAHNQALRAKAEVFEHQFIILVVDETQAGASGCSIDKSVHFLEDLGTQLQVDLFERMRFGWIDARGALQLADRPAFTALVQDGVIGPETQVVNTLVQTRQELQEKWLLPYGESWHRRL